MPFDPKTCPSPEDWDAYLLTADENRDKTQEAHLAVCQLCQVTVEWRKELLGAVVEAMESVDHAVISGFAPFAEVDPHAESLLAAQSQTLPGRQIPSISLVSADQRILLKVVKDDTTKNTWLYVIADESELFQNVVVRPFGDDREYITDESGKVLLGKIEIDSDSLSQVEIRIPRAVFVLEPFRGAVTGEQSTVLRADNGDEIQVSLHRVGSDQEIEIELVKLSPRATTGPLRIAIREEDTGRMRWLALESKQAKVGGIKHSKILQIYLVE